MADWIPIVSQGKSFVQWLFGDKEGALRTQINFSKQCPGASQIRSYVEYRFFGDKDSAYKTLKTGIKTLSGILDTIPFVGYPKSALHYLFRDKDGAINAFIASSRTRSVARYGSYGFRLGGFYGAAIGGLIGGIMPDIVATLLNYIPAGYFQQIQDLRNDPTNVGKWYDAGVMVLFDAWNGYTGGNSTHSKSQNNFIDMLSNFMTTCSPEEDNVP